MKINGIMNDDKKAHCFSEIATKCVIVTFGITMKQLRNGDKIRKYFYCRCALANLLKEYGYSLHQIGDIINRNHSTIAYYHNVHKILLKQVDGYREKYTECINEVAHEKQ